MPLQNWAFTGQSIFSLALAAGIVLVAFVAGQYWWERRKRREFRRSLEPNRLGVLPEPLAAAPAPAAPGGPRRSASSRTSTGHDAAAAFPAFGSYFLIHRGRYGLALLFVGLALLVRCLLEPVLQGRLPYGFFLLAVVATALVTDIWETLLALAAGFLLAVWFFVEPPGFKIGGADGWWGGLLYILTGLGIVWFMQSEHKAWLRALERDIAYFDRLKELDRERAARKQPDDRELLARIVASAQDAILSVTPEGQIATWNAAAERLFGFSAREAIGQPLALIVSPEHRAKPQRLHEQIMRGERTEQWQAELNCKSGSRIEVSLSLSPVHDGSGKLMGASAIVRAKPPKQ